MTATNHFIPRSVIVAMVLLSSREQRPLLQLPPETEDQLTITQGMWGTVWFWKGNFAEESFTGSIAAVQRDVYVYAASQHDSADKVNEFFSTRIHARLVTKIRSNATGFFQIALPPGDYRIAVKEDSLFYTEKFHFAPYRVSPGNVERIYVDICYLATLPPYKQRPNQSTTLRVDRPVGRLPATKTAGFGFDHDLSEKR